MSIPLQDILPINKSDLHYIVSICHSLLVNTLPSLNSLPAETVSNWWANVWTILRSTCAHQNVQIRSWKGRCHYIPYTGTCCIMTYTCSNELGPKVKQIPIQHTHRPYNFGDVEEMYGQYVHMWAYTLSDKISADKIFGGQNFSANKIFGSKPDYRHLCPPKFCSIRYSPN